jgi:hypothetical protein
LDGRYGHDLRCYVRPQGGGRYHEADGSVSRCWCYPAEGYRIAGSAQSDQFALLERVHELEQQVTDLKAWEKEKQRYELKQLAPGAFCYALKADASGSEPPHRVCAACYQHGKKSILQKVPTNVARRNLGMAPTSMS